MIRVSNNVLLDEYTYHVPRVGTPQVPALRKRRGVRGPRISAGLDLTTAMAAACAVAGESYPVMGVGSVANNFPFGTSW